MRSSQQVVVDWISDYSNYSRLKGIRTRGQTKTSCYKEIVDALVAEGITRRAVRNVKTFVRNLEDSYKKAIDWKNGTGNEIMRSYEEEGLSKEESSNRIMSKLPIL